MYLQEVEWGGDGLDLSGLGEEQLTGSCNEPSGSIKCGHFFD